MPKSVGEILRDHKIRILNEVRELLDKDAIMILYNQDNERIIMIKEVASHKILLVLAVLPSVNNTIEIGVPYKVYNYFKHETTIKYESRDFKVDQDGYYLAVYCNYSEVRPNRSVPEQPTINYQAAPELKSILKITDDRTPTVLDST